MGSRCSSGHHRMADRSLDDVLAVVRGVPVKRDKLSLFLCSADASVPPAVECDRPCFCDECRVSFAFGPFLPFDLVVALLSGHEILLCSYLTNDGRPGRAPGLQHPRTKFSRILRSTRRANARILAGRWEILESLRGSGVAATVCVLAGWRAGRSVQRRIRLLRSGRYQIGKDGTNA